MNDLNFTEGEVLLIDKPLQWTSFDVVKKLRYGLKVKKIGHAGTLDPLATGLLILCTGKKTKQIEHFQAQEKEYTGSIILGAQTASYDLETPVEPVADPQHITSAQIEEVIQQFRGEIQQVPPLHSAVKIEGKRAYEHARAGNQRTLEARTVTISTFEITRLALPELNFRIVCSKGTYIRSLAHDLGKALQVGGYLSALRRTRIGEFRVENCLSPTEYLATHSPRVHENS